jgi:hypothetical protein
LICSFYKSILPVSSCFHHTSYKYLFSYAVNYLNLLSSPSSSLLIANLIVTPCFIWFCFQFVFLIYPYPYFVFMYAFCCYMWRSLSQIPHISIGNQLWGPENSKQKHLYQPICSSRL